MEHIAAAQPDVIATGNPGCMLQLRTGVQQANLHIPVVHPIELLDASYQAAAKYLDRSSCLPPPETGEG